MFSTFYKSEEGEKDAASVITNKRYAEYEKIFRDFDLARRLKEPLESLSENIEIVEDESKPSGLDFRNIQEFNKVGSKAASAAIYNLLAKSLDKNEKGEYKWNLLSDLPFTTEEGGDVVLEPQIRPAKFKGKLGEEITQRTYTVDEETGKKKRGKNRQAREYTEEAKDIPVNPKLNLTEIVNDLREIALKKYEGKTDMEGNPLTFEKAYLYLHFDAYGEVPENAKNYRLRSKNLARLRRKIEDKLEEEAAEKEDDYDRTFSQMERRKRPRFNKDFAKMKNYLEKMELIEEQTEKAIKDSQDRVDILTRKQENPNYILTLRKEMAEMMGQKIKPVLESSGFKNPEELETTTSAYTLDPAADIPEFAGGKRLTFNKPIPGLTDEVYNNLLTEAEYNALPEKSEGDDAMGSLSEVSGKDIRSKEEYDRYIKQAIPRVVREYDLNVVYKIKFKENLKRITKKGKLFKPRTKREEEERRKDSGPSQALAGKDYAENIRKIKILQSIIKDFMKNEEPTTKRARKAKSRIDAAILEALEQEEKKNKEIEDTARDARRFLEPARLLGKFYEELDEYPDLNTTKTEIRITKDRIKTEEDEENPNLNEIKELKLDLKDLDAYEKKRKEIEIDLSSRLKALKVVNPMVKKLDKLLADYTPKKEFEQAITELGIAVGANAVENMQMFKDTQISFMFEGRDKKDRSLKQILEKDEKLKPLLQDKEAMKILQTFDEFITEIATLDMDNIKDLEEDIERLENAFKRVKHIGEMKKGDTK